MEKHPQIWILYLGLCDQEGSAGNLMRTGFLGRLWALSALCQTGHRCIKITLSTFSHVDHRYFTELSEYNSLYFTDGETEHGEGMRF